MGKRIAIILSALLVSALAIMGYFLQQGRKTLFTDPYKAISPRACIIIETVDLQSFLNSLTTGKGLFGETAKVREFNSFNRKLKYIADQLNKAEFKKFITDGSAIISFYPTKEGKLKTLLSITVPGEIKFRHIKEMLISSGINQIIDSKISGKPVIKILYSINSATDTAYISLIPGLMLFSSSAELIKEAGVQLEHGNDVRSLPGFSRVLLASGKNEDKIFIVFANLPDWLKFVLAGEGQGWTYKILKFPETEEGDFIIQRDVFELGDNIEGKHSRNYL